MDVIRKEIKYELEKCSKRVVKVLECKYGLEGCEVDVEKIVLEAMGEKVKGEKVKGEKVKGEKVKKVVLPFMGVNVEGCCSGLEYNHGLLSQCRNEKREGCKYCILCEEESKKNNSGKPENGCIEDRIEAYERGVEYKTEKGKVAIAYAKVMQKLKLTEEEVMAEAKRQNITMNREHFAMRELKRGRPKKEVSNKEEDVKRRGRPKKEHKAIVVSSTEDLFASLISEAKSR